MMPGKTETSFACCCENTPQKLVFTTKVYLTLRQGFNIKQQQTVPPGRGQISPHIAYKAERVQTPARGRRRAAGLAHLKDGGMECRREIKAWVFSE